MGSLRPPRSRRFRRSRWFSAACRPWSLAKPVHPLVSLTPLQSPPVTSPPSDFRPRVPSMGLLVPLIAASVSIVVMMSAPAHRLSVLDVSHVLDGLVRRQPSWVCFTPQPRPGFTLQGVSLQHSRNTSSVPVALSPVDAEPLLPVARQRHDPSPRPQGFSPCRNPLPTYRCLADTLTRSPLELVLLQVFPSCAVKTPSRSHPLMAFEPNSSNHSRF